MGEDNARLSRKQIETKEFTSDIPGPVSKNSMRIFPNVLSAAAEVTWTRLADAFGLIDPEETEALSMVGIKQDFT